MKITLQNHKLQLLLAATLTLSAYAFAPAPRNARMKSTLAYLDRPADVACTAEECSTLTALDAEMDTFASPNDKRYSAGDWLHNIANFHNSSILSQIRGPVVTITIWSTLVSLVHKLCLVKGWDMADKMCLGSTPHSFIASTIGLLLVFRTNSAYQKFRVSSITLTVCRFTVVLKTLC